MREYKVEVNRSQTFIVTVQAVNESEAKSEAIKSDDLDDLMPIWETLNAYSVVCNYCEKQSDVPSDQDICPNCGTTGWLKDNNNE